MLALLVLTAALGPVGGCKKKKREPAAQAPVTEPRPRPAKSAADEAAETLAALRGSPKENLDARRGNRSTQAPGIPVQPPVADTAEAPAGQPLPPGGGAPGAVALRYLAAFQSLDMVTVKSLSVDPTSFDKMPPDFQKEMGEKIMPKGSQVVGGTINDNKAVLDCDGTVMGQPAKFDMHMVLRDGAWLVEKTSVKTNLKW
jgi:hypothetical protein